MAQSVIAIVEDEHTVREVMQEVLEWEGYRVATSADGAGAMPLVLEEQPALVVLDWRLEQADTGLTVLQALRLDPATRDIPVIVCTADSAWLKANGDLLRQQGYAVLAKPFQLDEFLALVRAAVGPGQPA
jgi:CheY-like chemotaxis protein